MGRKLWEVIGLVSDGAFYCPDCHIAGEKVLMQELESFAGSSCDDCGWFIDPDGDWQEPDLPTVLEEMEMCLVGHRNEGGCR